MCGQGFYYFNVDGKKYYGVKFIKELTFDSDAVQHEAGKSNNDVEVVYFSNCYFSNVPQGLAKVFPKMAILIISSSSLKNLSKMDIAEYKNVRGIYFSYNQLEILSNDLLEDFKNLEWISFWRNSLKIIEPNVLDDLQKLKYVNFGNNPKYDEFFSIYPDHQSNVILQDIKNSLSEKFFSSGSENVNRFVEKIKENVKKSERELTQKVQELSDEIQVLKDANQNYEEKVQKLAKETRNLTIVNGKLNEKLGKFKYNSIFSELKSHIRDENFKDFKIEIEDREFLVHKALLTIRSATMAEMLRNNPEAINLKLVDTPVEVFETILNFLYTDELPREDGLDFLHLFAAASRLEIKILTNFAAENILEQINFKNALEILDLSNKYGHDALRRKAFAEIKNKYPAIEFKDEWAKDTEKIKKMIGIFRKIEAIEREFSALKD